MHDLMTLGMVVKLERELERKQRERWYVISGGEQVALETWCLDRAWTAPRPHPLRGIGGRILATVGDALIATGLWLTRHAADGQSA